MADNNSRTPQSDRPEGAPPPDTSVPVRLLRGAASPEELSALIAVVAVLSAGDQDTAGEDDHPAGRVGTSPRPQWNSPSRMVGMTHQPGPGGWRASAYPR